jgi:hypothetical protein
VAFESGEEKMLLACIRWALGVTPLCAIPQLANGVGDWPLFLELAASHGLQPVAADCLHRSAAGLPGDVSEILDRALRDNAKRVLLLTTELVMLTRLLDTSSVRAVALKGPVLAHACYDEPAHRTMSDLDLLVRRQDLSRATQILAHAGYIEDGDQHLRACRKAFRRWYNAIGFQHPVSRVRVDLHWAFAPSGFPGRLDPDELIGRARQVLVDGHPVRSLSTEDNLFFLCAHGAKHEWSGLNWVVDICGLIQRSGGLPALPPAVPGLRQMVWIGLLLADFLLDGSVPELANLVRWAPPPAKRSATKFLARFAPGRAGEERLWSRLGLLYAVSGSARLWAGSVLAQIVVPEESDWASLRIPWRGAFFLYYPWRLARLGWKWRPQRPHA